LIYRDHSGAAAQQAAAADGRGWRLVDVVLAVIAAPPFLLMLERVAD